MNKSAEALNSLRDIHPPEPVSVWPPALGWWILLGLIVLMAAAAAAYSRHRKTRHRRLALNELKQLRAAYARDGNSTMLVSGLSMLLRRLTLARFERPRVASLAGEKWLSFLDETAKTEAFSKGPGRVLISAPYNPDESTDVVQLMALVEDWIKKVA